MSNRHHILRCLLPFILFLHKKVETRTHFQPELSSDFSTVVEHTGFEPVTSTMRMSRASQLC